MVAFAEPFTTFDGRASSSSLLKFAVENRRCTKVSKYKSFKDGVYIHAVPVELRSISKL